MARRHCEAIFVKSEAPSLPLIYCKAKIVNDFLFVNVFHAVAVKTTFRFQRGIPCQSHHFVFPCDCSYYTSIQQSDLLDQTQ